MRVQSFTRLVLPRNAVVCSTVAIAALGLLTLTVSANATSRFKVLHAFCSLPNCADGDGPEATLLRDSAGNLFGTTSGGGDQGHGVIFELKRHGRKFNFSRLYSFCSGDCLDGQSPQSPLIADVNGNLYGTTSQEGANGGGTVFELTKAGKKKWTFSKLYDFCARTGCADGSYPWGLSYQGAQNGMPFDGSSPLFGTTFLGGSKSAGVAYELLPPSGNGGWTQTVIHDFCSQSNCSDGSDPRGELLPDGDGNLFGTASGEGASGGGVVFDLAPKGNGFAYKSLYSFCALSNCADGGGPRGELTTDSLGHILGITQTDGGPSAEGVVFQLNPKGRRSAETVLYAFCPQFGCADGAIPYSGVALDAAGNMYGTTENGGTNDRGVVFKIQGQAESVLFNFCDCGTGAAPVGGLVMDGSGNLYGTTYVNSFNVDGGTVFQLSPH